MTVCSSKYFLFFSFEQDESGFRLKKLTKSDEGSPESTLAEQLQTLLVERFGTISSALRALQLPDRRLRNSLNRNRFYKSDLDKLLAAVGQVSWASQFVYELIPEENRRSSGTAEIGVPNLHFNELCLQARNALRSVGSKAIVAHLFSWFSRAPGDAALLLWLLGDEEVIEWKYPNASTLTSVLRSVQNGNKIVYLFPRRRKLSEAPESVIAPLSTRSPEQISCDFEAFKTKLKSTLIGNSEFDGKLTADQIDSNIAIQFFESESQWSFPPFKHALIAYNLKEPSKYDRVANVNVTLHDFAQCEGEFGAILPLGDADAERLVKIAKLIKYQSGRDCSELFSEIVDMLLW